MKFILLFLVFSFVTSAQNSNPEDKNKTPKGLTQTEFEKGKELYIQMSKSSIYSDWLKKRVTMSKKLGQVELIDFNTILAVKDQEAILSIMRNNLAQNLGNTGFKTVDEGINLHLEILRLSFTLRENNPELYSLLDKATGKQYVEIEKPAQEYMRSALLTKDN